MLCSKADIIRLLRALIQHQSLISASLEGGQGFATWLLWVDAERERIALDLSANPALNQRVLAAKKLLCTTKLEQLEVKFTAADIQEARLKGQPVLCAKLPSQVYYPQRRQYYRLTLPKASPIYCALPLEERIVLLPALDLSAGGIGLIDHSGTLPLAKGMLCPNGCLHLPEIGEVRFDLVICSVVARADGQRIGGAFLNLSPRSAILIQRYLNQEQIKLRQKMPDKPSSPRPSR
ncbi:MAG: flagellar brake protein [Methylohalobius sp.]